MARHYRLSNAEAAGNGGFTDRIDFTYADLTETASNTAQTVQLITVPAGTVVFNAAYRLTTTFQDADDNAFNTTTFKLGDGGDDDRFIVSKELNENGTEVVYWATANATSTLPYMYTAEDTIDATIGSMTAKVLDNIDTGKVSIFLRLSRP